MCSKFEIADWVIDIHLSYCLRWILLTIYGIIFFSLLSTAYSIPFISIFKSRFAYDVYNTFVPYECEIHINILVFCILRTFNLYIKSHHTTPHTRSHAHTYYIYRNDNRISELHCELHFKIVLNAIFQITMGQVDWMKISCMKKKKENESKRYNISK